MKRYFAYVAALILAFPLAAHAAEQQGIDAQYYTTCRDAAEMASSGEATQVSELIARMGNASVEKRGLALTGKDLDQRVVQGLDAQCRKDPEALLIHAVDAALRELAAKPAK